MLPSTIAIGVLGLVLTIGGVVPFVMLGGAGIGNWFEWCVVAILAGPVLTLSAILRDRILRAPAGKYKGSIAAGFLGGTGIGADVSGGGGEGGGDGGSH
jgi:hypothetical protein